MPPSPRSACSKASDHGSPEALGSEHRGPALHLYGGGYRAALFHLGALTRLNELGLLANLDTVGAIAGGSILAALLAARVPWPLQGAFRDWPEAVAEPMRDVARRNARARALLRGTISTGPTGAGLEERYARRLIDSLGGELPQRPRFVFGAAGLALGNIGPGDDALAWRIEDAAGPPGYDSALVEGAIAAVRDDLDAFGDAEQAVLENHGYLLADRAVRAHGRAVAGGHRAIASRSPPPPLDGRGEGARGACIQLPAHPPGTAPPAPRRAQRSGRPSRPRRS